MKSSLVLIGLFLSPSLVCFAAQPPNVIIIMTDDQGYGDLGCTGNPIIRTPHLDQLHAESVRFTDFHVNPFCAPTRAALMTGRLSDRVGVRRTLNMRNFLPRSETTMPEIFRQAGYRTGLFGKWHLGHNAPYRPIDRGFDAWVGIGDCGLGATSDWWGNDRFNDLYRVNGKWEPIGGFNTDVFFDRAIDFISQKDNRPFFVYLPPNVPHKPWNVEAAWADAHREKTHDGQPLPKLLDQFYASIERVDKNVGRLREFLKKKGLADNTIVVFMSDNGTAHQRDIFNAGMRAAKGSVYEGGHRVPCFIHWPDGLLGKPRDIDALTAHFDLLPTLTACCGIKVPESLKLDGRSLLPLIRTGDVGWQDRVWVLHSQNFNETPEQWTSSVVLTPRFRLINGKELFDIQADPSQTRNIAAANPRIVARLRKAYEKHWDACLLGEPQELERPGLGGANNHRLALSADSWMLDPPSRYFWSQSEVCRGSAASGYWPIRVESNGVYRFELRRWPRAANAWISGVPKPIAREPNVLWNKYGSSHPNYRALPITRAKLLVGSQTFETEIGVADKHATFDVKLDSGEQNVRAEFFDAQGKKICGAYYVYVR